MILWLLLFVSVSTGLITIHTPFGDPLVDLPFSEGDYCSSPPTANNVSLVLVQNVPNGAACNNLSGVLPNVQGKIAFVPFCVNCCPFVTIARALGTVGAMGVIHGSPGALTSTSMQTLPLFCYGIGLDYNTTVDLIDALNHGEPVTADVIQPGLNPEEKSVIQQLYDQTTADSKAIWPQNVDPCAGTLPYSPNRPVWPGITCNKYGSITSLSLPFPLNGQLPDLCKLANLTSLSIRDDLSLRVFPWCGWRDMTSIAISGTSISTVSSALYVAPLVSLDLSNNMLTGPLPLNWSSTLKTVSLQGNLFSGSIPVSLMRLPNLRDLNLAQNQLEGVVPDCSLRPNFLGTLDLSDNRLSNFSLPQGNISVSTLKLSRNRFSSFPVQVLNSLSAVTTLLLDNNQLTSLAIPFRSPVVTLDVSSNFLSGTFNVSGSLSSLTASNNSLSALDFSVATLRVLDLSYNNFTNILSIPKFYPNLVSLSLAGNAITSLSVLPALLSLKTADFSNNSLTEELSWTPPPALSSLDLTNNKLTGRVSSSFLSNLVNLRLGGNPNLSHGSSSYLPPQIQFRFDLTRPIEAMGIECPTYYFKEKTQSEFVIEPSYHEYKLCRCLTGFYRKTNESSCKQCLVNAICPGREDPLTLDSNINIVAKHGFYPIPDAKAPTMMLPCRFGVVLPGDALNPCNPNVDELSNFSAMTARFSCLSGYSDRLCSRCLAGHFRKEGRCFKCNGRPEYPMFLILIVIIFLCACAFFVYRQPVDTSTTSINPDGWTFEPKQRVFDFVPLVLHFFQTSTIVLVKLESLDVVQSINSLLVTASFSTPQSGIGFECGLPVFQGFVTQYLAVVIFPPVLAMVLAFFFIGRIIHHYHKGIEQNWPMHLYQYIYGLFSMFEAIHFPLVTYVLGVFQCTSDPISGINYFTSHPYLLCDSISPAGKVFPLLLYPIGLVGFFIGLGVYLHYAPSDVKESEPILQSFAFFYIRFKPDRVASGVFFILINLSLSLVVGLMEPKSDLFPTLIIMVLVIDFFFITVFQPYLQPRYNKVRSVNLLVALLLFVNNLVYSANGQFPDRTASPVVIYVGLNAGMIVFFCYHIYRLFSLHRSDVRMLRANSGPLDPHRPENRKHLELADIKTRKHTNIDPPSTSHSNEGHAYAPVTTSPPVVENSVETSTHSPLPIINENDTSEFPSTKTSSANLVFTENPLADTSGASFSTSETPPSPSSKD